MDSSEETEKSLNWAKKSYFLLSDDVRMEINGKFMFIGTYTGKMIVPEFPMQGNFQCSFKLNGLSQTATKCCLSLQQGDAEVEETEINDLEVSETGSAQLFISDVPLTLKEAGILHFKCSIDDGPMEILEEIYVEKNSTSA